MKKGKQPDARIDGVPEHPRTIPQSTWNTPKTGRNPPKNINILNTINVMT